MRPDLESPHPGASFWPPKMKILFFGPPIAFPKLQWFCADPYTSQIELKFRIQRFGTVRQLLRHKPKKVIFTPPYYPCLCKFIVNWSNNTPCVSRMLPWTTRWHTRRYWYPIHDFVTRISSESLYLHNKRQHNASSRSRHTEKGLARGHVQKYLTLGLCKLPS